MRLFKTTAWAIFVICLCAPALAASDEERPKTQQVVIRVLDADGMPLEGARVMVTPIRGQAERSGPYQTDIDGEVTLLWRPEIARGNPAAHSGDVVVTYATRLRFLVSAKGYLQTGGEVNEVNLDRKVADEAQLKISRQARLLPVVQDVQLRSVDTIMPPEILGLAQEDPLRAGLRRFFFKYQRVAQLMGSELAAPAFGYSGDRLSLILHWRRPVWIGLDSAPVEGQVLLSVALPMAVAMGEDLAGLPGVGTLVLVALDEAPPENDPYALPKMRRLVIEAPVGDFQALAAGKLDCVAFLLAHRPTARLR